MVNGAVGRAGQYAGQAHSVEEDSQQETGAAHRQANIVRETQWRPRSVTSNVRQKV